MVKSAASHIAHPVYSPWPPLASWEFLNEAHRGDVEEFYFIYTSAEIYRLLSRKSEIIY